VYFGLDVLHGVIDGESLRFIAQLIPSFLQIEMKDYHTAKEAEVAIASAARDNNNLRTVGLPGRLLN